MRDPCQHWYPLGMAKCFRCDEAKGKRVVMEMSGGELSWPASEGGELSEAETGRVSEPTEAGCTRGGTMASEPCEHWFPFGMPKCFHCEVPREVLECEVCRLIQPGQACLMHSPNDVLFAADWVFATKNYSIGREAFRRQVDALRGNDAE